MRTRSKSASSWTRAVRARTSASNNGHVRPMISDASWGAAQPIRPGRRRGPTGEVVRVVETADHRGFCIVGDERRPWSLPVFFGDQGAVGGPQLRSSGSLATSGMYHLFAVPSGFPSFTVHDEGGADLLSARS